jgi:hypothetical protein
MLTRGGVVISVPPVELGGNIYRGSVFDSADLADCVLSDELRAALYVLTQHFADAAHPLPCVARPEIGTHGVSLAWLQNRVAPAEHHICLSDGSSFRPIPGLRNHLFVYGIQRLRDYENVKKFGSWAPDLFAAADSQINSLLTFPGRFGPVWPPTMFLPLLQARPVAQSAGYGFYLNSNSIEDSVDRLVAFGERTVPTLTDFSNVTYIPMTETALTDLGFCHLVAELIARIYFEPQSLLLLGLPFLGDPLSTPAARIAAALRAIAGSRVGLPRALADNVVFLKTEPAETDATRGTMAMVAHESFSFWRYTEKFYAALTDMTVVLDPKRTPSSPEDIATLRHAFGQRPVTLSKPAYPHSLAGF